MLQINKSIAASSNITGIKGSTSFPVRGTMEDSVNIAGMMFRANVDVGLSITYADGSKEVCGYTPHELVESSISPCRILFSQRRGKGSGKPSRRGLIIKDPLLFIPGFSEDRSKSGRYHCRVRVFNSPLSLSGLEGYIIRIFSHHVPDVRPVYYHRNMSAPSLSYRRTCRAFEF